jgi:hypothetical protein
MCFDFLQKFCLQLFPTQEKFTEVVTEIYVGLRVKYLLFLCDINHTYICNTQYKISWKSIQHKLGCSMWTDSAPPHSASSVQDAFLLPCSWSCTDISHAASENLNSLVTTDIHYKANSCFLQLQKLI